MFSRVPSYKVPRYQSFTFTVVWPATSTPTKASRDKTDESRNLRRRAFTSGFHGHLGLQQQVSPIGLSWFRTPQNSKKKQRPTSDLFVRWWQLKYFLECSPLLGKMIQFDEYFSDGLQPPTSFFLGGRGKIACIKR